MLQPNLTMLGLVSRFSSMVEILGGKQEESEGRSTVSIQDLEYADDMTLVSDSMDVLEEVLRTLHTTCSGMGLSISCKKSKILAVRPTKSTSMQP